MRPPIITRQPRLHRAGSVPCKPKTLKMMPTAHFPTARPPLVQHVGAAHTRACPVAGVQGKPRTLPQRVGPTCKGHAVASQALTGFQLRPLRLVLLPPRRWRVKGGVHFTLDALNRPNTHRRGRWPPAPCGLASERVGFGAKPQGLVFFLKLLGWM